MCQENVISESCKVQITLTEIFEIVCFEQVLSHFFLIVILSQLNL